MTRSHDPTDDELVSAVLDGEASPEEAARVRADPALRTRLEELRVLAELVREVPSPDDAERERRIAAALGAASPAVVALDERRTRGRRVLATAAVVALVLLAAGAVGLLRDSDRDVATVASDAPDARSQETEETGDAISGDAPPLEMDPQADLFASGILLEDLGTFEDTASLRDAVVDALDQPPIPFEGSQREQAEAELDLGVTATDEDATLPQACVARLPEDRPELGTPWWAATATLSGEPVVVIISTAPEEPGRLILTVLDHDCEPVHDGSIDPP